MSLLDDSKRIESESSLKEDSGIPKILVVDASAPLPSPDKRAPHVCTHSGLSSLTSEMRPPAKVSVGTSVSSASSLSSEVSEESIQQQQQPDSISNRKVAPFAKTIHSQESAEERTESTGHAMNLMSTVASKLSFQTKPVNTQSSQGSVATETATLVNKRTNATLASVEKNLLPMNESPSKRPRLADEQELIMDPNVLVVLSRPSDAAVLSPLHVFVRKNVEVFTATPVDLGQPSPGRKTPISLHQVGLRCIHCKHMRPRDRVKRAVCFPTSVGRVYHSVSDMKFDHFSKCKGLPVHLKAELEQLRMQSKVQKKKKQSGTRSNFSSTAQYYHDSARQMGMVDSNGGVFMSIKLPQPGSRETLASSSKNSDNNANSSVPVVVMPVFMQSQGTLAQNQLSALFPQLYRAAQDHVALSSAATGNSITPNLFYPLSTSQVDYVTNMTAPTINISSKSTIASSATEQQPAGVSSKGNSSATAPSTHKPSNGKSNKPLSLMLSSSAPRVRTGPVLLSSPMDSEYLNDIHCFVRKHVHVFEATREDISAPAPGRRHRIALGQVGIRCIHCQDILPRLKRSICYPPSIHGLYHAVSNMKFDHFGLCKQLPKDAKEEFRLLRSAGPKSRKTSNSSMAKYYVESAKAMGLEDTDEGIRFVEPRQGSESPSDAWYVSDGMSALMMAATDPELRAAFEKRRET